MMAFRWRRYWGWCALCWYC